jgi:phage gp45-like
VRDLTARVLKPITDRIRGLIGRGVVTRVDSANGQGADTVQVRGAGGTIHDRVRHALPYGFAAHPRLGSEVHLLWRDGGREAALAFHIDPRLGRPSLAEGEFGLFHPETGAEVRMAADGTVRVKGDLVVDGAVRAEGDVTDSSGSMAEIRAGFDIHTHGTPSGPSTPPTPTFGS